MSYRLTVRFLPLILCLLLYKVGVTQTFPSGLVTTLLAPNSIFLDEYADPFQPKIKTTILFTDFTESSWNFNLRLKITGPNGILIQTKPGLRSPAPFVVAPGQAFVIQGADLAFYFNYNHLNFSGISRSQLEVNNRLPEGLYTFCFEATDYQTGEILSHPACASAYLKLNDPPIVISPSCGSVIESISQQNILFQWQLSNANGNLNVNEIFYTLNLYEVNNQWTNPNTAILNNQALPIWQSEPLQNNTCLYSTSEPLLEKGKRYVFTVKANESQGRGSFKNNGYSAPCYFHFGYEENDTIDLIYPEPDFQFALGTSSQFKWKKPRKAISHQLITYTLRLVELGSNQDAETALLNNTPFYEQTYVATNATQIEKTIPVMFWTTIKRMGQYAWQVTAQSGTQVIAKSKAQKFTGPPAIENFIAGGFLMRITKLSAYDTVNRIISGSCKTRLHAAPGMDETEFKFSGIHISSIGNNEWVMSAGSIRDKITVPDYTLQPQNPINKPALFKADSILVGINALALSGPIEWQFPHASTSQQLEKLVTKRCRLQLANSSFYLSNDYPVHLQKDYQIPLLEPFGFVMKLSGTSFMNVNESSYGWLFKGYVQLPGKVNNHNASPAHLAFENSAQLHYITQQGNMGSESIRLATNTKFGVLPTHYVLDFSEEQSPGEFKTDSAWKGCYIVAGNLELPTKGENSGQITLPVAKNLRFENSELDSTKAYITHRGLYLTTRIPFAWSDSVRFNSFTSKNGSFYTRIVESEIKKAYLTGGILIPVIDTLKTFPYLVELGDYGFNEGYLLNGLANYSFTFNAAGGAEQQIPITIKRAVFKGKNRLEMDLNLRWPHFQLQMNEVQRFSVWGNGNIGFDLPNGKAALSNQAQGKAGNFDITVDYLGCGRNGNAYAFGASAKINLDEEISGETGPPVVNMYSICKNPLLSGSVSVSSSISVGTSTTSNTGGSTTTNTYQSSTGGYSTALNVGLNDALGSLGFKASDTLRLQNPTAEQGWTPLLTANSIVQIKALIDILYRLKPFIPEGQISDKDWRTLDGFKTMLNANIFSQSEMTNGKDLLNFMLSKVVEGLVNDLNASIQSISDKANGKIRSAINEKLVNPVNSKINSTLTKIFSRLETSIKGRIEEQYHAALTTALVNVRNGVSNGIQNSVYSSFESNITSKLTGFIQMGVTAKVKSFISREVGGAAQKLIQEGPQANISLSDLLRNTGSLFETIADTVQETLLKLNAANFVNTAESLVDDAIAGIDWNAISNQLLQSLIQQGVSQAVASNISEAIGANAGPYVAAALSTVKFDFTNLGDKLKNGEFDKIVKFDPTTIYIQSPAADIRGSLRFTKDDPVYGDSWQADVFVRVKVPKKDNPIELTAFFLNGKTINRPQNFTYWFVKLGAKGFNIPLNPVPVVWYGVEGFAYSKMKKTGPTTVTPDNTTKFGLGCKFNFRDQASAGKTFLFNLGAEADFNEGGFAIQLVGDASVLNYQKVQGVYQAPGFVTGQGYLGYFKTPECTKVAGNFSVKLNTEPILCAGGDVGLDIRSANNWKIWVGTQQNPIGIKVLCKDFLSNTGFMEFGNSGFKTGLDMKVNIAARSPWIQFNNIKVRGFANLNFGYHAYADISFDPNFSINEATIGAWLVANIGIDYETALNSSSITLAGISLSGSLTYKSQPESELHGSMAGSITVLNYNLGFSTPVHYSLSKQQIID